MGCKMMIEVQNYKKKKKKWSYGFRCIIMLPSYSYSDNLDPREGNHIIKSFFNKHIKYNKY